jgi:hypothetical protein
VAWSWANKDDRYLIVVNLSGGAVQGRVHLPWDDVRDDIWRLTDAMSGVSYDRAGNEVQADGLYVESEPWGQHVLQCRRLGKQALPERSYATKEITSSAKGLTS